MEAEQGPNLEAVAAELEGRLNQEIERVIRRVGCERMGTRLAGTVMGQVLVSRYLKIRAHQP